MFFGSLLDIFAVFVFKLVDILLKADSEFFYCFR